MKDTRYNSHLSAEQLQAFLEGELSERDASRVEEHLAGCVRCSSELEGWKVLFEDLGSLDTHGPTGDFAERVMAGVEVATPALVGEHPSAETLHEFLDGVLTTRRTRKIEQHLEACAPCSSEADAWLDVFGRLAALEAFTPQHGFADRVMAGVEVREPVPIAARLRAGVSALLGLDTPEHVPAGILQDFVERTLPAKVVARVEAHHDGCDACANEAAEWGAVMARLGTLGQFAPAEGFAGRVMDRIHASEATAVVRRPAWSTLAARGWTRALGMASRVVPQTRQAWAALSGVAVTPAVIAGLVLYTVFSHPTLTLGSLASYAWWQVADLAAFAFEGVSGGAVQLAQMSGAYSLFEMIAAAPMMVGGGVLAYCMVCVLALRVLYKNLIAQRPAHGRIAHVSAAS